MVGCCRAPGLLLLLAGLGLLEAAEKSLYGAQDAGLSVLERSSVSGALYNSSCAWLLEFYSSWCGHCINYAPTWRLLASDVQDWAAVVRIGALNCADEENTLICKDYGVSFYPSFRFFAAFTKEFTQGENYKADADREVQTVRQVIIDYLQNTPPEHRPPALPSLQPISLDQMSAGLTQGPPRYTAIIIESEASYVGREVILDLGQYENIEVLRALDSDKAALERLGVVSVPSCYLIYPNASRGLITTGKPLRSVFSSHLKSLPDVRRKAGSQAGLPPGPAKRGDEKEVIWKDYDKSRMYTADLESGLHYLLRVELATHQTLEGDALKTFKELITLLYKLFPGRPHVVKLLETLQEWLVSIPLDTIPYDAILDLVNNKMRISGIFLTSRIEWVGCQGSQPQLRGYPCSLWKLFHSLTVQAAAQPSSLANTEFDGDPQAVLRIMSRYIAEFFGCRECAQHFEAMARESLDGVRSADEAVLWLWRQHNVVNKRLAGAHSEDPRSPKVQWPTPALCPACHEEVTGMHRWNEREVLAFLKRHYSSTEISWRYSDPNTSEAGPERGPTRSPHRATAEPILKPELLDKIIPRGQDPKPAGGFLGLGFSRIDMSLCALLYLTSALFLVLIFFFFKARSRRWKIRHPRPYV